MNTRTLIILIAAITTFTLSSCTKDDNTIPVPTANITELGYENSRIAYAGSDLHIEADVVAEGTIDNITVQISPFEQQEENWEADTTYTEFSGLKNTTFHKHIEVPDYAEEGYYSFSFIVKDMEGQETIITDTLEIKLPDDDTAPVISVSSSPSENQVFNNGETISISGIVSDDQALGGLYIGLVRVNQNLSDESVNATNTIALLHTHDFEDSGEYSFSAEINIGATYDNNITPNEISGEISWQSSDYYIIVKTVDAFGGNWTFSDHYSIIINY